MEDVKIYGLCLERLKHQIALAKKNGNARRADHEGKYLLESYCTGDAEEIIDILELYDIERRTSEGLWKKLDELVHTLSLLARDPLVFAFGAEGHLGLYLEMAQVHSHGSIEKECAARR